MKISVSFTKSFIKNETRKFGYKKLRKPIKTENKKNPKRR